MKAIEGSPKPIDKIFMDEFVIPEFQRPYSWEKENCIQLWDDLSDFFDKELGAPNGGTETYFLGSIVIYPQSPEKHGTFNVIDGQQRLTTMLMLVNIIYGKLTSHQTLKDMVYKKDPDTGGLMEGEPRVESQVLGDEDKECLKKVLAGEAAEELDPKNRFRVNYENLADLVGDWWRGKDPEQIDKVSRILRKQVVMLPIQCSTEDDALTLFQIINDRGRSLSDADIFKAKIYKAIPKEPQKELFIDRWNGIKKHEGAFRAYMHILRAKRGDVSKESGLRKYMDKEVEWTDWESVMHALEVCDRWRQEPDRWSHETADDSSTSAIEAEENIYWKIFEKYPNGYWNYPLLVFLHKHVKARDGMYYLPVDKHEEYKRLMEFTVRYFFIKGMVYNAVNYVRDTTYAVCKAISHEKDYVSPYRKDIKDEDFDNFQKKLESSDGPSRSYQRGLVFLNSSLNISLDNEKLRIAYGEALAGTVEIEHILPISWNNYDQWSNTTHEECVNKIGNLMPLEKKCNIKASNEFFSRKQAEYKKSKIQEALDLANGEDKWLPQHFEKRQKESVERLMAFFQNWP